MQTSQLHLKLIKPSIKTRWAYQGSNKLSQTHSSTFNRKTPKALNFTQPKINNRPQKRIKFYLDKYYSEPSKMKMTQSHLIQ